MPGIAGGRPLSQRRFTRAVGVALAGAAIVAPTASAHLGQTPTVVSAGPYRLVIVANPVAAGPRPALAFAATITAGASGEAVDSASVRIVVVDRAGQTLGGYRATGFDGDYSVLVPIPSANSWRDLRFTIAVRGALGAASAQYRPPALLAEWSLDPLVLAFAAVGSLLFLQGFVRLRRRGRADHASFGRLVLFALGLCLMVGPLLSPLDPVADRYLLSAHMLQHVLIGDAAPALLLLAMRGPLIFFVLPRRLVLILGRSATVRRGAVWLLRPRIALGAWALAYGGWHVPAVYDFAATHQTVHDLEHASFVVAGFLVWILLIDPAGRRHLSRGRRLCVAAAVFAMGTVISDVLIFSFHPLYPFYANQVERVFSLAPLRDQQLAGLVMTIEQVLTLGTFALVLLLPWLRPGRGRRQFVAGRERLA